MVAGLGDDVYGREHAGTKDSVGLRRYLDRHLDRTTFRVHDWTDPLDLSAILAARRTFDRDPSLLARSDIADLLLGDENTREQGLEIRDREKDLIVAHHVPDLDLPQRDRALDRRRDSSKVQIQLGLFVLRAGPIQLGLRGLELFFTYQVGCEDLLYTRVVPLCILERHFHLTRLKFRVFGIEARQHVPNTDGITLFLQDRNNLPWSARTHINPTLCFESGILENAPRDLPSCHGLDLHRDGGALAATSPSPLAPRGGLVGPARGQRNDEQHETQPIQMTLLILEPDRRGPSVGKQASGVIRRGSTQAGSPKGTEKRVFTNMSNIPKEPQSTTNNLASRLCVFGRNDEPLDSRTFDQIKNPHHIPVGKALICPEHESSPGIHLIRRRGQNAAESSLGHQFSIIGHFARCAYVEDEALLALQPIGVFHRR